MTPSGTAARETTHRAGSDRGTDAVDLNDMGAVVGRARRRPLDLVRLACHLAAELPFVVLCLIELSAGWRPTSDDAVFSWRAWNVISSHPTLLGSPTHGLASGGQPVFAPGPILSWLLAIPVHLDPLHGPLWGSALIGAMGAGVAVEAGRAAAGRWGMVLCAGAILVVANTQVGVVLNPLWTPWIGVIWFLAALAAAWATGCGRLGWWVAVVGAASLAAQAHVIYALPAVGLCLLSAVLGWVVGPASHPTGRHWRWIGSGLVCAALLWLPALVQQLSDRPGNLTLLWRSSHQPGGRLGLSLALRGLSSASRLPPSWAHRLPGTGPSAFFEIGAIVFGGSAWWGGAVVLVLTGEGAVATLWGRRRLAVAAWTAATASVLTVAAVAAVPSSDAIEIDYLNVIYVPVGIMACLVMAAGLWEASRSGLSILRSGTGHAGVAQPTPRAPDASPATARRGGRDRRAGADRSLCPGHGFDRVAGAERSVGDRWSGHGQHDRDRHEVGRRRDPVARGVPARGARGAVS